MLTNALLGLIKINRVFAICAMKIVKLAQGQTTTTVSIVKLGQRKILQAYKSRLSTVLTNALLGLTKINRVLA